MAVRTEYLGIWLAAIALLLLGCCGQSRTGPPGRIAEKKMAEESVNKPLVSMEASARVEANKLVIDYAITNRDKLDVYLFDRMIAYNGNEQSIDEKTAYCFVDEPATLRVVRATLRLPLEKEIRVQEIPYSRKVGAGETVKGTISLPVPVPEKHPYYLPPKEENSKAVDCDRVRLMIGWTEYKQGMNVMEVEVGGQKVLRVRGAWPAPYQHLLQQDIPIKVQAIAHTDLFDRQMPLQ